jgi:hypothetical protein
MTRWYVRVKKLCGIEGIIIFTMTNKVLNKIAVV